MPEYPVTYVQEPLRARLRRIELQGIVFVIVVGTLLHFAWEWCGRCLALAPIAAVNESVWEHLKLVYWPFVVWGLLTAVRLRVRGRDGEGAAGQVPPGYWLGKAVGALLGPALIVALHYAFRLLTGTHALWFDILIFVVAAVAAQLVSLRYSLRTKPSAAVTAWSIGVIVLIGAAFAWFTFRPPLLPIFRDSLTGGYGISR